MKESVKSSRNFRDNAGLRAKSDSWENLFVAQAYFAHNQTKIKASGFRVGLISYTVEADQKKKASGFRVGLTSFAYKQAKKQKMTSVSIIILKCS